MYFPTLFIHSWLRWIFLIVAILAIFKALVGWQNNKAFAKADNALGGAFIGLMHLQLVIGLILYFGLSPFGYSLFGNEGLMKNSVMRFWAVEHISMMILAVVVAQVGRILSKKAPTDLLKHKRAFLYFTISLVMVLSRIPWTESARFFRLP